MSVSKGARIGVLLGGLSKEREISFRTGRAMAQALRTLGYKQVIEVDAGRDVAQLLAKEKIEVALIALHGRFGEDGTIQGLLEFMRIPYSGTGVRGSAIAMDKVASKRLFQAYGVKTPPWIESGPDWNPSELPKEIGARLGFPAVVKPSNEGSTIGLSIVRSADEVAAAQKLALEFDDSILWEKFIQGTELTVGFLKNEPLPIVEIVPKKGFYDYEAKYTKGMTEYFCPARVSEEITGKTQAEAKKAFRAVQAESYGRVDTLYADGEAWVLEVNTIPGMTETSLLPKAFRAAGGTFEEMVQEILNGASLKLDKGVSA